MKYVVLFTKIGNINLPTQSTARLLERKQNRKVSVSPVMGENELLFPVSTPQAIFEFPKLYHSAVIVLYFRATTGDCKYLKNVTSTGTSRTILRENVSIPCCYSAKFIKGLRP